MLVLYDAMDPEHTYRSVQERYAAVANQVASDNQGLYECRVASAFGYDVEELRSIPVIANLGVSCGNPLATANIKTVRLTNTLPPFLIADLIMYTKGETVVDLGSGGGIDVLLAAQKVGPEGKAIGIDMTKVR